MSNPDDKPISAASNVVKATDDKAADKTGRKTRKGFTLEELGWTMEQAIQARGHLASFAADWDDPSMDVYDDV